MPRRALALAALLLSGCGSLSASQLPPAAEPRDSPPLTEKPAGRVVAAGSREAVTMTKRIPGERIPLDGGRFAVIAGRERVVEVFDANGRRVGREPAGVGPTHGVYRNGVLWVTDTQGDALLVFRIDPELRLDRRLRLRTGPYGIALDPVAERLWVTLTGSNRIAELPAHGRPHVLATFPTVRQPNDVAVDSRTGRVFVGGRADGVVQLLDPPDAPRMQRTPGVGER